MSKSNIFQSNSCLTHLSPELAFKGIKLTPPSGSRLNHEMANNTFHFNLIRLPNANL